MTSRRGSVACTALAAVMLMLGLLAGLVNHHVLDGQRFADHVDSMRQDPAVAHQIGQAITQRVLVTNPDLIALRPLVEASATSLATSSVFTPVVTTTARQVHEYFTSKNSGQLTVRLADIGSILSGILPSIAPDAADTIPPGLGVTLGRVADQSVAARWIRLAHFVGVLAWLLPLLAILLFGLGLLIAPDRQRDAVHIGYGVSAAGAGVGLVWLAGVLTASSVDTSSLRGALAAAAWHQVDGAVWWTAAITVGAGALAAAGASARLPNVDIGVLAPRVWARVAAVPERRSARALRAALFILVGLACVLRPGTTTRLVVLLVGWVLLVSGVGELASVAGATRREPAEDDMAGRKRIPLIACGLAAALLIGLLALNASPAGQQIRTLATSTTACNGYLALCDRPYNDVSFAATHNAMAAANEPGWFIPEQPTGLVGQLNAGVRALLIDTWYGQSTQNPRLVATAPRSFARAKAEAEAAYGPAIVASAQRLRDSFAHDRGPVRPYMCHGLCETGATLLEPAMRGVRDWMSTHPRDVVTIVIEDNVTPEDTIDVFRRAGLLPFVHTQRAGQRWPTLREMIDSGHRLIVMMERRGGGQAAPWLLPAFDWMQDTAYTNPTLDDLSCDLNRGSSSDPLFMINNWLSTFRTLVSSARQVNAFSRLLPYAERCQRERGQIPNFIAVNFYNEGAVFRVVARLNGFR